MTGCNWMKRSLGKAGECACDLEGMFYFSNHLPNSHCTDLMCFLNS